MRKDYIETLQVSFQNAEKKVGADKLSSTFFDLFFNLYPETKNFFKNTDVAYFKGKKLLIIYNFFIDVVKYPNYAEGQIFEEIIRHQMYGLEDKAYYYALVDCLADAIRTSLEDDWTAEVEMAWNDVGTAFKAIIKEAADIYL